jgi:hypothetical protein
MEDAAVALDVADAAAASLGLSRVATYVAFFAASPVGSPPFFGLKRGFGIIGCPCGGARGGRGGGRPAKHSAAMRLLIWD